MKSLFYGKICPISTGHLKCLKVLKDLGDPYVGCSSKTNLDIALKDLEEFCKENNVKFLGQVPNGFMCLEKEEEKEDEDITLVCGTDRLIDYQGMVGRFLKYHPKCHINLFEIPRDEVSSTKIRESIRNNDFNSFRIMYGNKKRSRENFEIFKKYYN